MPSQLTTDDLKHCALPSDLDGRPSIGKVYSARQAWRDSEL